jgi:hypothetical protein
VIYGKANVKLRFDAVDGVVSGVDVTTGTTERLAADVPAAVSLTSTQTFTIQQLGIAVGAEWTALLDVPDPSRLPPVSCRVTVTALLYPGAADPVNRLLNQTLLVRDVTMRSGGSVRLMLTQNEADNG